jgi:hypothetical protein
MSAAGNDRSAVGDRPPAEFEEFYYRQRDTTDVA